MIKTVIFDVGGTLIGAPDLFEELTKLFPHACNKSDIYYKIKDNFMDHYASIGNELEEFECVENIVSSTLKTISKEVGCDDKSIYAKKYYYNTFVNRSFLYEDTLEILDYLKNKEIRLIIASDADAELLYDEFKLHKLEGYFEKCFISSELKAYKPSDKIVNALKVEVNEQPDKTIIVGDSIADIITGNKLGIKTVFKGDALAKGIKADYSIKHLKELIEIVG